MPHAGRGGWLAAVVLGMAAATTAAADKLAPFLTAHQQARELAEQKKWQDAAKAYGAFAAQQPNDSCAPLASILQGIILRRELGRPADALAALARAAKAPDTPFGRELKRVALGWLARFQMAQIDAVLRKYYIQKVEYPEKLEALVERKLITAQRLLDPWGKPLSYRVGRLRIAPDVPRQSYTLRSTSIQGDSRQLEHVLKESAAFPGKFRLRAIGGIRLLTALIAPTQKGKKPAHVAQGETIGSAKVIKLTRKAVVLVDGELVAILTR